MSIVHYQLSIPICGCGGIGERPERCRWQKQRGERVAAVCVQRRRADAKAHTGHRNRKTQGNFERFSLLFIKKLICGCGGIGRLIGFRFQRASVQVRVLSPAPYRVFITDLTVLDTRFSFSAILLAGMEFVCTNSLLVTVSDSNAPCTLSTINLRLSEKLLFGCVIATSINL